MTKAEFSITDAALADYPAVVTMMQALALEEGGQSALDVAALAAACELGVPRVHCLVAHESDVPTGCVLAYMGYDVQSATQGWHVSDIYVMPDKRGQGVGRALLKTLAQQEKSAQWMSWTVLRSNKAARLFYDGLGAQQVDVAFMALGAGGMRGL